jgi:hypothetical protein
MELLFESRRGFGEGERRLSGFMGQGDTVARADFDAGEPRLELGRRYTSGVSMNAGARVGGDCACDEAGRFAGSGVVGIVRFGSFSVDDEVEGAGTGVLTRSAG